MFSGRFDEKSKPHELNAPVDPGADHGEEH
jgi:hypothetical protein